MNSEQTQVPRAETYKKELETIPVPDEGAEFKLLKIEDVVLPHPYCITPAHILYTSRHRMSLSADVIREAEKEGKAVCGICKQQGERLSYDEHVSNKILFVGVPNYNLEKISGLKEYLFKIKPVCEELKIQGFAFPVVPYDVET